MPKAQARLVWSAGALDDLARLRRFIQPANPAAARRAAKAIVEAVRSLRQFPRKGQPLPGESGPEAIRELVVPFGGRSYVVRYQAGQRTVVVLQLWHGREHRDKDKE